MNKPKYIKLSDIQRDLKSGSLSMVDLVNHYLENANKHQHLNAFIELWADEALEKARKIDSKIKSGEALAKLHGMVVSVKDNILVKGHIASAGSRMLEHYEAVYSATAIDRLLEQDVILIGRSNCDEFGMGSENKYSHYGSTYNGFGQGLTPGGSSGGAAVSVQIDACFAALGSDTGGSVRQPAALCGLVGFKPSYGTISRYGLISYASTFDQIGVISHSLDTSKLLVSYMAGPDEFDMTARKSTPDFTSNKSANRVFYLDPKGLSLSQEVREAYEKGIERLLSNGAEMQEVNLSYLHQLVSCYYILTTAEASSNLSRYDGVRYGYRNRGSQTLDLMYRLSRSEGFGTEVKKRIILGTFVLSEGYYDAYYQKAQKIRRLIRDELAQYTTGADVLVTPTQTSQAWDPSSNTIDKNQVYLSDIFTVMANLAGFPAISVPIHQDGQLPIGIQIMSAFGEDDVVLNLARLLR